MIRPAARGWAETVITFLEMRTRPDVPRLAAPPGAMIVESERPTLAFYRFLYDTVGEPWLWTQRRIMEPNRIAKELNDPRVHLQVLWLDGTPAGFCEMDYRPNPEIGIAYFGLMPDFIGRGLGRYFLNWAIHRAFDDGATRLFLNTCEHDHPRALETYIQAGFKPIRREVAHLRVLPGMRERRTRRTDRDVLNLAS